MDFNDLVKEQPELKEIKAEASNWYGHPDRWRRYESLKARVKRCVGWKAPKGMADFMYTRDAYDIAHKEIFK